MTLQPCCHFFPTTPCSDEDSATVHQGLLFEKTKMRVFLVCFFTAPCCLQVLIILLQNPINSGEQAGAAQLPELLARATCRLRKQPMELLVTWLATLPADVLGGRILRPLQRHLTAYVEVCTPKLYPRFTPKNAFICRLSGVSGVLEKNEGFVDDKADTSTAQCRH